MDERRLLVAFAAALIGAGLAYRFGGRWFPNVWLRVLVAASVAGVAAFLLGRSVNLALRAVKLLTRMLG